MTAGSWWPTRCLRWQRVLSRLLRWPFAALTTLLAQGTTHPIAGIEEQMVRAGFHPVFQCRFPFGTLALLVAEKT